jgi:hypothetical protein
VENSGRHWQVTVGAVFLLVAVAVGLVLIFGDDGSGDSSAGVRDAKLVGAYCLYGSDTKAELLRCEARTQASDVRSRDDDAARYARRELRRCRETAGDLCGPLYRGIVEARIERELR